MYTHIFSNPGVFPSFGNVSCSFTGSDNNVRFGGLLAPYFQELAVGDVVSIHLDVRWGNTSSTFEGSVLTLIGCDAINSIMYTAKSTDTTDTNAHLVCQALVQITTGGSFNSGFDLAINGTYFGLSTFTTFLVVNYSQATLSVVE